MTTTFQDMLKENMKDPEFAWEFSQEQSEHIAMLYELFRAAEKAIDNSMTHQVPINETEVYREYMKLRTRVAETGEYPIWI